MSACLCMHLQCMGVNLRCVRVRVSTAPGDVPGRSASVPRYRPLGGEERPRPPEGGAVPSRHGAPGKSEDGAETAQGRGDGPGRLPEKAGRTSRGSVGGECSGPRGPGGGELAGLGRPAGALVRGRGRPAEICALDQGVLRFPGRLRGALWSLGAAVWVPRAAWRRQPPISSARDKIPFPPRPAPSLAIPASRLLPASLSTSSPAPRSPAPQGLPAWVG